MRIRTKLICGFSLVFTLAAILGYVSLIQLKEISAPLNRDIPLSIEKMSGTLKIDGLARLIRYYDEVLGQAVRNYAFTQDKRWEQRYHAFEPELDDSIRQIIEKSDEANRRIFTGIEQANIALVAMRIKALEYVNEGDTSKAVEILEGDAYRTQKQLYAAGLRDYFSERGIHYERSLESSTITVKIAAKHAREILQNSIKFNLILLTVITATLILVSIFITRSIANPLKGLVSHIDRIRAGDLSGQLSISSKDEIGDLARAFNQMTVDLQNTTVSRDELAVEVENRKRAEEVMAQHAEELERSNAELEQFAYVASHDLQEPLRMVSSYVQLLERRYKGRLDSDAEEFIGYAVDGATRMRRLINDLLAYSRVGTRSQGLKPTDCQAVLATVISNLRVAIEESGAVVTHDTLPTVIADDTQLTQLLQNLIGNAIKFHGEKPPSIHISAEKKENEWIFSVRDNGIGIGRAHADRIFLIFQRLHTREEYSGTGIGLAICKKIVDRHGGHIWVDSEPNQGSTFHFTMPVK